MCGNPVERSLGVVAAHGDHPITQRKRDHCTLSFNLTKRDTVLQLPGRTNANQKTVNSTFSNRTTANWNN